MSTRKSIKKKPFEMGGPSAAAVLIICSLLWGVNFMDRQVLSVVLEPIRADLGLTDSQAGWITTALLLGMALFAIPAAYWSDRWSRKKSIGIMAIAWSLATGLTGWGQGMLDLFILRLLTGAGQAGFSAAAMALISASHPEEVRGQKLGFFNLFQIVGIFVGLVFGGYLSAGWGGWRVPFFVFAIPGLILGIAAFFMQDDPVTAALHDTPKRPGFLRNIQELLKMPTIAWFYAGYTLFSVVGFSALAWLPTLMMRRFAIDERFAGLVMAGAMLFTIPGALLGGVWADRWHSRHPAGRMRFAAFMVLLCTVGVVMAVGFIFLLHPGGIHDISIWFVVGALMLALFCAGSAAVNPAVMAATQSVVDREHKALVWGLGLSIMMVCGGAWAPAVAGNLSDRLGGHARGLSLALLLTSMLGFGGTGCLWKSACRYPAEVQAPVAGFSYLQRPGSLNAN